MFLQRISPILSHSSHKQAHQFSQTTSNRKCSKHGQSGSKKYVLPGLEYIHSYIQPNLSLQSILQDIKSATLSKLRLLFGFYWLSFPEQPNIQISVSKKKCKLICKYLNPKLTLHQVGAVIKCQRTKVEFFCISLATILLYLRQQCTSGVPCVSQQWYTPNSKRRNATLVQIKQALNPRRLANLNLQLNMIAAP